MVDHQGQIWVFLAQSMSFQFSKGDSKGFSPLVPMPAVGQLGPEILALTTGADNEPLVIWQAIDPPGTSRIVFSRWTPQGWSRPVTIDTMPSANYTRSFDALRDPQGRVHLVYDRPLDPPEKYKLGVIAIDAVDVFTPHKAFHACLSGGSWSRPVSTTAPGRFDFRAFHLSLDSGGAICLSGVTWEGKTRSQGYLARQYWRDGQWSGLKVLARVTAAQDAWIYSDLCGVTHLWHSQDRLWQYQQLAGGDLKEATAPCRLLQPIINRLPDGRIALLSLPGLTVWNGTEWSDLLSVQAEDMGVSPTGSILLWQWRDATVKLRQVSIVTDTALGDER
ncbi:MAG TPA: hypothetical protein PKY77_23590 [Phycisphaerae bacterium]|nr:hypothetical protein [Phycisphaerae bacterium]HRY66469.1 hypothetical protein [Phycisphaerae bacterium]HSA25823.1 hypothetical protein [Phycisphaerae bacterium]